MNNNACQMMKAYIEWITIECSYSISSLEVQIENRFWLQDWIDNIAEMLETRDIKILKYVNEVLILTGNITIMDMAV